MIHVLYITHITGQNGATKALVSMMREMKGKGVRVSLVVPEKEGWLNDEARSMDIQIVDGYSYSWTVMRPPFSWNLVKTIMAWIRALLVFAGAVRVFYSIFREQRPDIVHTNTSVLTGPVLASCLLNIPHVWHIREYIDKDFGFRIIPSMSLMRLIMKMKRTCCVAITRGVFQHFRLCDRKDVVIYDGVIGRNEKVGECLGSQSPYKYFLFVGNMMKAKGLDVLLEQFAVFAESHPTVHLNIAAGYDENDANYKKCLKIVVDNNIEAQVHFLGFCKDVASLMRGALALVVPSRFEGFGFITVEAMLNGCLVIGNNTAGTKEQFDIGKRQTGSEIGLRYDNASELPVLMNRALEEDFREMKENARRVVLQNYTIEKNADDILCLYKKILLDNGQCH